MTKAIDPDDLQFLLEQGVRLDDLAERLGVRRDSLLNAAKRDGVHLPAWSLVENPWRRRNYR
jgi:hypothetical protein